MKNIKKLFNKVLITVITGIMFSASVMFATVVFIAPNHLYSLLYFYATGFTLYMSFLLLRYLHALDK